MIEIGNGACFDEVGFGVFGAGDDVAMRHLDRYPALQLTAGSRRYGPGPRR
jgi:hypothetical protein